MLIETQFDLGQTVYRIGVSNSRVSLPCKFCRGQRNIRVDSPSGQGYEFVPCPICKGQGKVTIGSIPKFERIGEGQIGSIEVRLIDPNVEGYNGFNRDEREERYMLSSSGFPSGSVFVELFGTAQEAQDECDRRNELIEDGDEEAAQWWLASHDRRMVAQAQAFLDHADAYEHDEENIVTAQRIIRAASVAS